MFLQMAPSEAVTAERRFAERSSDSECRRPPAEVEGEILRVLVGTQHLSLTVTLTYDRLFVDSSLFPPAQKAEPTQLSLPGQPESPPNRSVLVFAASQNRFSHS